MNTHNKAVHQRTEEDTDGRKMRGRALKTVMETALSTRQMSVSGLAREANVQRGDIYRWWRGESRPTRNSLARVAETLQVDTGVLRRALGEPDRTAPVPDLATAISELAGELRADREERRAILDDRLETLENGRRTPRSTSHRRSRRPSRSSGRSAMTGGSITMRRSIAHAA